MDQNDVDDPYLQSGVPLPVNLLQSLRDDPALEGVEPQLSALRLSKSMPSTSSPLVQPHPLRAISRKAFRAIPALSGRVRYNKSASLSSRPTLVASLDIDIPSFMQYSVDLRAVMLKLPSGEAEDLSKGQIMKLPVQCRSRDNIIFLYRLSPRAGYVDGATTKTLDISISATVLVSDICRPEIEMRWKTGVDFSTALNPSYGAPGQSMQRNNRPASLPPPSSNPLAANAPVVVRDAQADLSDSLSPRQKSSTSDSGITATFTGAGNIYVGEPFKWRLFVVNRSSKPRKLAVLVIPKRKKGVIMKHISRPPSSSNHASKKEVIAEAVIDDNYLYAMQRAGAMENERLVCLTTDLRIGYVPYYDFLTISITYIAFSDRSTLDHAMIHKSNSYP